MARKNGKVGEPTNNAEALRFLSERLKGAAGRPNIIRYSPHTKQQIFHSAETSGRLFIGGNRSGKTTAGITEDLFWLRGRHEYRAVPPPPIRGRIIGVDFLNGIEKILKPELARWAPMSELRGGSWSSAYDNQLRTLYFENGSFVEFMSYDQDLDKFAGTSRHFIHFDEEPPQHIFTENRTRLIDTGGHWWLTMTPVEGMSWIYDDIYLPGKKNAHEANITVVEVDMGENPHLNQNEVDAFVSGLSEDERQARVHGQFVQRGGLIYKMFDPDIHVIDPFIPPAETLWTLGLDHGFNNPTAVLWTAANSDGDVYVFGEHYESNQTIDYHAQVIHKKNEYYKRTPDVYIADPSIRNTDPITGTSIQTEYGKNGIFFTLANNDVDAGINRVATYLKPQGPNKRPKLFITRNCVNLINEMQRYRWATYASRKFQFELNVKETPHKKFDHACDALRYAIMSRPDLAYIKELGPNALRMRDGFATVSTGFDENLRDVAKPVGDYSASQEWQVDEYLGADW